MSVHEFIPYLSITNADEALRFYSDVFKTEPTRLLRMPDGRIMHAEFQICDVRFFLSEELPDHGGTPSPKSTGSTTVAVHVYVDDCDRLVTRMRDNGAEVLMAPTDMFWGERFARVRDPFGHEWGVTTHLRDMTTEEIRLAANELFPGPKRP